ncbi:MAG TPA: PepSY domain-containing protein [Allosphingosinicella sp.]|jgi:uncharacterized membrane protein YkoI
MSRYLIAFTSLLVAPALAVAAPIDSKLPAISKVKATRTALAELPGKITSWRLDTSNGEPVYVFTIAAPNQPLQQIRVSGVSGKVL